MSETSPAKQLPSIRKACLRDVKTLALLINSIFPHANASERMLKEKFSRGVVFFIAECEREPVGFAEIIFRKQTAFIQGIGLKKQFEGKGAGSALLERCAEESVKKGKTTVLLTVKTSNARALGFYKTHGFELAKEKKGVQGSVFILKKTIAN
ncbi:GNAT family N-acetyltransferase [Candidatus Micrarchaeota archaeon]|nr:GNAT family N-acetyltransferase [Candidatus Micrarchaeota archaeon]